MPAVSCLIAGISNLGGTVQSCESGHTLKTEQPATMPWTDSAGEWERLFARLCPMFVAEQFKSPICSNSVCGQQMSAALGCHEAGTGVLSLVEECYQRRDTDT